MVAVIVTRCAIAVRLWTRRRGTVAVLTGAVFTRALVTGPIFAGTVITLIAILTRCALLARPFGARFAVLTRGAFVPVLVVAVLVAALGAILAGPVVAGPIITRPILTRPVLTRPVLTGTVVALVTVLTRLLF